MNMKRVRRLYRLEGLPLRHKVRRRKHAACIRVFRRSPLVLMSGGAWILSTMRCSMVERPAP